MQSQLHIPQGIRFQCTACGHCCHEYPVPLTDDDVMRLRQVKGDEVDKSISLLSPSERGQPGMAAFSHSLDKYAQGTCSFLVAADDAAEEKGQSGSYKCSVHDTAKPAMCKLFPYSFMHCPDGLKVALSFASTGVLLNSGPLLVDENPLLAELKELFENMHPDLQDATLKKWAESEFVAGAVLDYADFCDFSQPYLKRLEKLIALPYRQRASEAGDSGEAVLSDMFDVLWQSLPEEMLSPLSRRFPHVSPIKMDHYILMPLYRAYIAALQPVREDEISQAVMTYLQNEQRELYFVTGERKVTFEDLTYVKIEPFSDREQDLINRFIYIKLFARLYFGPGFCMLPLLSGVFHLASLICLVKLALKIDSLLKPDTGQNIMPASEARFDRLVSLIRDIDRRLTAVVYSRNTASMFELFALDPERMRRFMVMAN